MHAGALYLPQDVHFCSHCVTLVLLWVCPRTHAPTQFLPFRQQLCLIHFRVILGNACYPTFHAQDFVMNMLL
jgi:hypothetical protein